MAVSLIKIPQSSECFSYEVGNSNADNWVTTDLSVLDDGLWLFYNSGVSGNIGCIVMKRGTSYRLTSLDWNATNFQHFIDGSILRFGTASYYRDVRRIKLAGI